MHLETEAYSSAEKSSVSLEATAGSLSILRRAERMELDMQATDERFTIGTASLARLRAARTGPT